MKDEGTCPVCGREHVHLNVMTGMLTWHYIPGSARKRCSGENTPPAESMASRS